MDALELLGDTVKLGDRLLQIQGPQVFESLDLGVL